MFVARWYAWALLGIGAVGLVGGPILLATGDTTNGWQGAGFGLIALVVALLVLHFTKDKA